MHNKYRARTNKLLGSLTMVRCPKALCLSEENMSQMGRGWIPLHCGAETSSVLLSCSLLISWFIFFCLSFRNSPLTFMLLSVRISTASLTLLICLTWWGFHVFFSHLNNFLNKSDWNLLTCIKLVFEWEAAALDKGCPAFSHAVPSPEEYNLYLQWSSLSLFTQVTRTMAYAHFTPAIIVSFPNCCLSLLFISRWSLLNVLL